MHWFYGIVPLVHRPFFQTEDADEEWMESDIDMICSSEEIANNMVQTLNQGRFTNIPCFFGINCHALRWKSARMNSYDTLQGFVVWYDTAGSFVYTEQPKTVPTVKIVLHHHYPGGIRSVTSCA
jgi:hypothetical protein